MSAVFTLWTVFVCVVFLGVVVWVMRRGGREEFDAAARIPLEDGDVDAAETIKGGH